MNTTHYFLLYDDECAFCRWYTRLFVRTGFIESPSLIPYQLAVSDLRFQFDTNRATAEIALVSDTEEKVRYGIDSLLFIIGRKWSWVERIGRILPIYFLLTLLYKFLSYNRKIFAPMQCSTVPGHCEPKLNYFWRIIFIATCAVLGGGMLSILGIPWSLTVTHFIGLLLFQFCLFYPLGNRGWWNYAGQLAWIGLLQSVLIFVSPILILPFGYGAILLLPLVAFGILFFVSYRHNKRVQEFKHPEVLTIGFVAYQVILISLQVFPS